MKKSFGTDNTPSFNLLAPLITALSLTVLALLLGILYDTSPSLMSGDYARFSKHLGVFSMLMFIFSASLYVVNKMSGPLPAVLLRFFRKIHLFTGLTAVITGIIHGNYFLSRPRKSLKNRFALLDNWLSQDLLNGREVDKLGL